MIEAETFDEIDHAIASRILCDRGHEIDDPFAAFQGRDASTALFLDWYASTDDWLVRVPWSHLYDAYLEYCYLSKLYPLSRRQLEVDLPAHGVQKTRYWAGLFAGRARKLTCYTIQPRAVSLAQTWEMAA